MVLCLVFLDTSVSVCVGSVRRTSCVPALFSVPNGSGSGTAWNFQCPAVNLYLACSFGDDGLPAMHLWMTWRVS